MYLQSEISDYSSLFNGIVIRVPTLNSGNQRYINLDNAASTPPFKAVNDAINEFSNY